MREKTRFPSTVPPSCSECEVGDDCGCGWSRIQTCGQQAGTFVERMGIPQWEAGCIGNSKINMQLDDRVDVSVVPPQCPQPQTPTEQLLLPRTCILL